MSPGRRMLVAAAGSLAVMAAGGVLVWSAVSTSTARLSATTDGTGFFSAGTVDLDQPETVVALLFDADGLYPGQTVTSCVVIAYEGSVPADVRLHAAATGGTELERYVVLRLRARVTRSGDCPTEPEPSPSIDTALVFDGVLADLWATHSNYDSGLELIPDAETGDRVILSAEAELLDGNDSQGRTTEFTVVVEARP